MNTVDENRVVKKKQSGKIRKKGQIDWMITLLPLGLIAALSILFFLLPEQSNTVLAKVRFFLGDTFGVYYLAIGLGVFLLSLYLAFSKYGDIVANYAQTECQFRYCGTAIPFLTVRSTAR